MSKSTVTNEFFFSESEILALETQHNEKVKELQLSEEGFQVLPSSEFLPQVREFVSRAYLGEGTTLTGNFKVMPWVKNSAQIAYTNLISILKDPSCDFPASTSTNALQTITVSVRGAAAMLEMCQYDLEQTFVANEMAKGANATYTVGAFFTYMWEQVSKKINEELSIIRWVGNIAGTGAAYSNGNDFKKRADGFIKKLDAAVTGVTAVLDGTGTGATTKVTVAADGSIESIEVITGGAYSVAPSTVTLTNAGEGTDATFSITTSGVSPNIAVTAITVTNGGYGYPKKVIAVSGTSLSASNIIAEMTKVFNGLNASVRSNKKRLRFYMSPVDADTYMLKVAEGNNINYITQPLAPTFLGIPIVVEDGMPEGYMVCCRGEESLLCVFDGTDDQNKIQIVDLMKTMAVRKIRARVDVKQAYYLLHEDQITYYYQP